jgi:hypothetical protein
VAGIDIAWNNLLRMRAQFAEPAEELVLSAPKDGQATFSAAQGPKIILHSGPQEKKPSQSGIHRKETTFVAAGQISRPHLPRTRITAGKIINPRKQAFAHYVLSHYSEMRSKS